MKYAFSLLKISSVNVVSLCMVAGFSHLSFSLQNKLGERNRKKNKCFSQVFQSPKGL